MSRRIATSALLALLVTLALNAPARAAEVPNHSFRGSLVTGKLLEDPCGVAVDPVGDIYISDYYHHNIGLWEHVMGNYAPVFENVATPNGPCGLAIDHAGTIYIHHWHGAVANPSGQVLVPGPATGIAVDPGSGDLYVNERTSIGVYEAPVAPNEAPTLQIGTGSLEDGYGVAVSTATGEIYAADAATNTVKVYDPAALEPDKPVRTIDGAGTAQGGVNGGFVSLVDASLVVDQTNGHLFVADNTQPGFEHPQAAIDEFTAEGLFRGALKPNGVVIDGGPVGLAVNESATPRFGEVYVTTGNGQSEVLGGFDPNQASSLLTFGPAGLGRALEVTRSGAGQGGVTSNPAGIACPGACKAEFNSGKSVTLTATPAPGSTFVGWSGGCSGTGSCQLPMEAATTVNAGFAPAPAILAAPNVQGAAALAAAVPPTKAPTTRKPKRSRHRFARAKTIASGAHRPAKEKK